MKQMKYFRFTLITLCSLLLAGCNREDDLTEIFTGKEWHLVGFYKTHDWDNPNAGVTLEDKYNSRGDLSVYNITFFPDGMVAVTLPQGCKIQGHWEADGVRRTFSMHDWKVVSGDPRSLVGYGKLMYDNLLKVSYYQGDSYCIRLFDDSRRYYMQFGDLSKFYN
jgi:hypothetical protein